MMKFRRSTNGEAFTLIELLIVVAIIAILAAIAIPNFLEAQTRSKVSRAKADLRTLATGIEAYTVDYSEPPSRGDRLATPGCARGWVTTLADLTTPVAYLTTVLADVFQADDFSGSFACTGTSSFLDPPANNTHGYDYSNYSWQTADGTLQNEIDRWNFRFENSLWKAGSAGPDLSHTAGGLFFGFEVPYDPTNGTISYGNIMRWSGSQD